MIETNKSITVLSKVYEEPSDESATAIYVIKINNEEMAQFLDTCNFYSRHPDAITFEDEKLEAEVKDICEVGWREYLYDLCDVFDQSGYFIAPGAMYSTYSAKQINQGYFVVTETVSLNV